MLLHVCGQLFGVLLFQGLERLIIRLELSQLLFVLTDAAVEASFSLLELAPEIFHFGLVVSFN